MYTLLTSPPAIEPLTLADAKTHARVTITADDSMITANITAARQWVEAWCNISLITQSWTVMYDFKDDFSLKRKIRLPLAPVQSITAINTFDSLNNETLFASSNYFLSNDRIALNDNSYWPDALRLIDCLQIQMVTGFGSSASNVPNPIILAMKELVAYWYEKRLPINDSLSTQNSNLGLEIPFSVKSLLQPYRNIHLC